MFNLLKLGLHFTHSAYGALDPMVLELIRTERLMRQTAADRVAEPEQLTPAQDSAQNDDIVDDRRAA